MGIMEGEGGRMGGMESRMNDWMSRRLSAH